MVPAIWPLRMFGAGDPPVGRPGPQEEVIEPAGEHLLAKRATQRVGALPAIGVPNAVGVEPDLLRTLNLNRSLDSVEITADECGQSAGEVGHPTLKTA